MKTKLTHEEEDTLHTFEQGAWIADPNFDERKKTLMDYARNTLRKDKRLNIRISSRDLLELQKNSLREGLPYQTYVASILHKFVNGTLVEAK